MKNTIRTICIIVPCFNEEESLPQLFSKLDHFLENNHHKYHFHFMFVDDGSTDSTLEVINENVFKYKNSSILSNTKNLNLGGAIKVAICNLPDCDYVAFLDSDCTYEPEILLPLIELIESGHDLASVSPYSPLGKVAGVPPWRLFLSRSLSIIYRIIFSQKIYTFSAMVRVMKKEVALATVNKSDDFTYITKSLLIAINKGYRIGEVPTTLNVRKFGISKMKINRTIIAHIMIILNYFFFRKLD